MLMIKILGLVDVVYETNEQVNQTPSLIGTPQSITTAKNLMSEVDGADIAVFSLDEPHRPADLITHLEARKAVFTVVGETKSVREIPGVLI